MVREQALYPYNLSILEDLANNVTSELIDELFQLENEIDEVGSKKPATQHIIDTLPIHLAGNSNEKCPICLEKIKKKQKQCTIQCGHTFHTTCIHDWLKRDNSCPICRKALPDKDSNPDYIFVTIYFPDTSILYKSFHIDTKAYYLFNTINKYIDKNKNKMYLKTNNVSMTNIENILDKSLKDLGFSKENKIKIFTFLS